jgi:hypothetical protein
LFAKLPENNHFKKTEYRKLDPNTLFELLLTNFVSNLQLRYFVKKQALFTHPVSACVYRTALRFFTDYLGFV